LLLLCCLYKALAATGPIQSEVPWYDSDGNRIEAHGGGITLVGKTYYWYGETKKTDNLTDHGVNCYSSIDLVTWHFEREVLYQQNITGVSIPGPYIVERPHVLFNAKTNLFVLWFHLDSSNYGLKNVGVATSTTPNGEFKFLGGFQPDGLGSLDMTVYADSDGSAYLIRAVENMYVGVSKLTDDYLNTTGITSTVDESREAPAVFKYNNQYYLITSHESGWGANGMEMYVGGSNLNAAQWITLGNPTNNPITYDSQSTNVLVYPYGNNQELIIYQGDRWNQAGPGGLLNATYVWLPIVPAKETYLFTIPWLPSWNLP